MAHLDELGRAAELLEAAHQAADPVARIAVDAAHVPVLGQAPQHERPHRLGHQRLRSWAGSSKPCGESRNFPANVGISSNKYPDAGETWPERSFRCSTRPGSAEAADAASETPPAAAPTSRSAADASATADRRARRRTALRNRPRRYPAGEDAAAEEGPLERALAVQSPAA